MNIVQHLFNWLTGREFVCYLGGGGGGSPPPSTSSVTNTNIPEYARPYVEQMLGAAQQNVFNYDSSGHPTNIKPYQPFSNDPSAYVAGFSPMQKQSFQGAANMQSNPQSFAQDVSGYMSPYAMNAMMPQLREMERRSAIQGTGEQAQAAQAGAFGGARDALQRSERERNLGQQESDVMASGMQNAFNAAQNQYNTAFGQNLGINQMQNQFGAQQQAQQQGILNQQIQNYATAQQYPMMQLANMSNLLRGLPMQASTTQGYQAAPSTVSQLAGLGTAGIAGLGLYNTMNKAQP
jgi:hypothetical protein